VVFCGTSRVTPDLFNLGLCVVDFLFISLCWGPLVVALAALRVYYFSYEDAVRKFLTAVFGW
jgi:hypothetical protein